MDWIKLTIVLLGGLAIFLYGMDLMSEGLNKAAGNKIRGILNTFTKNRFAAFLTGTIATTIVQSSSAVSVMVVSLVEAGLIKYAQTFGILLGAGIGTTITAQIIAFKITDYSLLFIAIGFLIRIIAKKDVVKFAAGALLGFGFLFYGLHLMSDAMYPLRSYEPFINVLLKLENPVLGIAVGLIFTAIIQSSSAFIGILIVLATQGLLSLDAAIPLLLGSNIGTTVTAILASLKTSYEAKRVAVTFFIIKLIGVVLIIGWIPAYTDLVKKISLVDASADTITQFVPRQIANAHTVFNVLATIVLLPFTSVISKLIIKLMPPRIKPEEEIIQLRYLRNKILNKPVLAISMAKKECLVMGKLVRKMLDHIIQPFIDKNPESIKDIESLEQKVDEYQKQITEYTTKISQQDISSDLAEESFEIVYIVSELEEIADIIYNTLLSKATHWCNEDIDFTDEGKQDIQDFHSNIQQHLKAVLKYYKDENTSSFANLKKENKQLKKLSVSFKEKHFERLSKNVHESINTSENHMEVIGALRAIHSRVSNILRVMSRKN